MSTTPIIEIPAEILGEIFYLLSPGPVAIPSIDFDTLWAAAQTCSRWRTVALGLCHLWNNLIITFPNDPHLDHAVVYYALLRSQTAPLFLEITQDTEYAVSKLSFLIPHSIRIRRLSINCNDVLTHIAFPNLEFLSIELFPDDHAGVEQMPALVDLRVGFGGLPSVVMKSISQGKLWPSLRYIECKMFAFDMDEFLDMIESRAGKKPGGSATCVSDVVVRCLCFGLTDSQRARVRSLQEQGMRIDVEEWVIEDWMRQELSPEYGTGYTDDDHESGELPSLEI